MDVPSEVSYLVLAATTLGCITVTAKEDIFFLITAGVTLLYAVLGALRKAGVGDSNLQAKVEQAHEQITILIPLIVLPALDTAIWVRHNVIGKVYGFFHAVAGVLMSVAFTVQSMDQQFMDALVAVESLSLVGAGFAKNNYFAMYAGGIFLAAYYLTHHYDGPYSLPISKDDLYQYLLATFMFLAMQAANSPKCPFQ